MTPGTALKGENRPMAISNYAIAGANAGANAEAIVAFTREKTFACL